MQVHIFKLFFLTLFSLFLLVGCGGVEYKSTTTTTPTTNDTNTTDTNSSTDQNTTITGQFLDAYVVDMNYTCSSGLSGVTDSNGSYTCNIDDNVTFILGTNSVVTFPISATTVTPYSLFPTSIEAALNYARLLQSLDGDTNSSVITLNKTLEALLPNDLNLTSPTFESDVNASLGITLVSANAAQTSMNAAILADGGTLPLNSTPPVANAGSDINSTINSLITLDGTSSVATTYIWDFISKPAGSASTILNATTTNPTFVADKNGTYEIELTVNANDINFGTDRVIVAITDPTAPTSTPSSSNTAPDINVSASVDVYENQTAAFTISATDVDNDSLVYSLSGADSASFTTDPFSGVVSFTTAPDYETKTSYSVIASVSDGNLSDEQNVTVNILNIAEKPSLQDSAFSIAENSAAVSTLGQVTIVNHGDSTINTFTLSGVGAENFSINSSGVLSTTSSFDYETKTQYTLEVNATNSVGTSPTVNVVVNVTNVNDIAPTLVDTSLSFREDAVGGDIIGSVTIDSAGDSPISSISVSGTGASNFECNTSGVLSVKAGATFDYETTTEYNLTAQATNSTGLSNIVNIHLQVNNVLDQVAVIADSVGSIDENATVGTTVGTLTITSSGDSNITSIDINGTGSSYFAVANDGTITLSTANVLDYETVPSYTLVAVANNTAGVSNSATITITIGNIPEVPILQNTSMSIMENELSGAVVGTILIDTTSADSGDSTITDITLSGTGNSNFVADTSGQITLSSTSTIDYETTPVYTLSAVATNAAGTSASVTVTIDIGNYVFDPTKIASITASDAGANDHFGSSVAISGNYIVVGSPNEDAGTASDGGSAYLYKKAANGAVTQIAQLHANTPVQEEYFGYSVAIEGNVIVVGAPESNGIGNAYVFVIDANDSVSLPAQQIGLVTGATGDTFGSAVAISGDYIVVGAPGNISADLFKLDANKTASWVHSITVSSLSQIDKYGSSVAIDGDYIVVGAPEQVISGINGAGSVYLYKKDASDNIATNGVVNISPIVDYDYFGSSVGISGNYVVVGAYGVDELGSDSGNAYLYKITATSLDLLQNITPNISPYSLSAGDSFGYSIGISGEYIIIGANKKDFGAANDAGSAYIYHIDTNANSATYVKKLDAPSSNTADYFASSVYADGDFFVVGAPNDDLNISNGGAAYLYDGEPAP